MTLAGLATVLLMLLLAKRELDSSGEGLPYRKIAERDERLVVTAKMLENRHHLREPTQHHVSNGETLISKGRTFGSQARNAMATRAARMIDAGSQAFLLGGSIGGASISISHGRSKSAHGNKLHMA